MSTEEKMRIEETAGNNVMPGSAEAASGVAEAAAGTGAPVVAVPAGIPQDDGHQMSQSEIDALIAMMLGQ